MVVTKVRACVEATRLGFCVFLFLIVTAAATHVPPPLIEQLKPGGDMVIPVGGRFTTQWLLHIEKSEDGEIVTRQIAPVRFVPLTGGH